MNGRRKKYFFSVGVIVIIAALTLYMLLKDNSVEDIWRTMRKMAPPCILAAMLMVVLYILFEGLGMRVTLSSFGTKVKVRKCFAYAATDMYYALITPSATGGQPVMLYTMNKDGVPFAKSAPAILINTICFKTILMILGAMIVIFKPKIVFGNGAVATMLFILGILFNLFLIAVCFLSMFHQSLVRKFVYGLTKILKKIRIIKNPEKANAFLEKHLKDYAQCTEHIKRNKIIFLKVFLIIIFQRLSLFSISFFVYTGLGYSELGYFEIILIQAAIAISVNSLPVPGAAGVTEAVFALLYSSIYPDGQVLVSALLLTRIFDFYFSLVLSGGTTLINHISMSRKRRKKLTT